MALATLSIDLVAKVASFEKDLKRVADSAEQQSNRMAQAFNTVKGGLAGLAAGFSVGAIATFVRDANNAIDALNDVADATGASIESISALENVARDTGANLDTVSGVLVKFNQVLNDTNPNSGAAQTLRAIGLSAEELRRIDPAEALQRTARALAGFADDGNKARAVQELFGKSVREAAPFLKDLAEAGELNASVTKKQADEADRFNKQLFRLQKNSEDLGRALASQLVPILNRVFEDIGTFSEKANLAGLASDVIKFNNELQALEKRRSSPFNFGKNLDEEIAKTRAKLEEAKRLFNAADTGRPRSAGGGRGFVNPDIVRPSLPDPLTPEKSDKSTKPKSDSPFTGLTFDEQITQRVGKLFEESDVTRAKEYEATIRKLDELFFSGAINSELYESAMKKLNGSTSAGSDKASQFIKDQERLQELLRDSVLDDQRRDMELLAKALEEGAIKENEYLEAVTRRLNLTSEKTKEAKGFAEEFGLAFSSAFEDAIVKGESLSKVIEGLGQDILRIALRKSVTEPLGNAVSGFFKNLFSFDGGGYTGSGSRTGGMDGKGGFLAMVHPNETIIDHTKGGGGQQVVVHNHFTVGDVASVSMVRQAVAGSEARIASSLNRSMKYGGAPV